jgi:hypothetical protein
MNSKKTFIAMSVFCFFSLGMLAGSVFFGNKMLQSHSEKLTSLKVEAAVAEEQQTLLTQAKKDLDKYAELNDVARQIVPQDKDQARAVREIIAIANESGIQITGITFPASTLGQAAPKATTTEGEADATKKATPTISQVKPVDGITGVYQLELNVTTDTSKPISYAQLIGFLKRLEQNRRTAQITNLSIQPNPGDRTLLTLTMQLIIYIKP